MSSDRIASELDEALNDVPLFDAHTHLTGGQLGAQGLHDIALYHMVVSDLYAAGCPDGARLTEFPGVPSGEEAHARLERAIPYLSFIRNTSCFWGLRIILRDLYDWTDPVTLDNWRRLDDVVRERASDRAWQREILSRARVAHAVTELARRGQGADDDLLHYSMEWAFFTRTQRDEYDTALYELERCWGLPPGSPIAHGASGRPCPQREIRSLADVHEAMAHYIRQLAAAPVLSMATHLSSEIEFRDVSDRDMAAALTRRGHAGPEERDIYASYIHETFLSALERETPDTVFQFSFAAEPLPHETGSIIPQRALADLARSVARHPRVRFLCLLASRHANQTLCTLCRELPNLGLAAYWWHNFFPGAIQQVMQERLDMLPMNRQIGFFSDAYCVEWTFAKAAMVRTLLARVLARKVSQGQYSQEGALQIARFILKDAGEGLLNVARDGGARCGPSQAV